MAKLPGPVAIIELDHVGIEKDLRTGLEVDAMLSPVRFVLDLVPVEIHGKLLKSSM